MDGTASDNKIGGDNSYRQIDNKIEQCPKMIYLTYLFIYSVIFCKYWFIYFTHLTKFT